jgi:hypothetical protein
MTNFHAELLKKFDEYKTANSTTDANTILLEIIKLAHLQRASTSKDK